MTPDLSIIIKAVSLSSDPGCAHFSKKPGLARRAWKGVERRQGGNIGVACLGSWGNESSNHSSK